MPKFLLKNKIVNQDLKAFTLIEVLVATTLFVVVAVGGLSVLLSSQRAYQRISSNRVAMDNINLVMDTMTREIKFGTGYGCLNFSANGSFKGGSGESQYYNIFPESALSNADVSSCNALAITPEGTTTQKLVYYYDVASSSIHQVSYDKVGTNYVKTDLSDLALTGKDFKIDKFWMNVYGKDSSDYIQPRVDIYISGIVAITRNSSGATVSTTTLFLQSSVTERIINN